MTDWTYDAGAIVALAIAQACEASSPAIRDAIPQVTGTEEFKKAPALIGPVPLIIAATSPDHSACGRSHGGRCNDRHHVAPMRSPR